MGSITGLLSPLLLVTDRTLAKQNFTTDAELNYLLELNKMHRTPTVLGVILITKNVIESERKDSDRADNNDRGFWETVEIVPTDDVVIPETVASDRDVAITRRIP